MKFATIFLIVLHLKFYNFIEITLVAFAWEILKGRTRPLCLRKFSPLIISGNIVREIEQYLQKWLQHLKRMDKNWIPKQALQYEPTGRRNIGRLRKLRRNQLHLEN